MNQMITTLMDDWEFNSLNINNFRRYSFKKNYYSYIKENHDHIPGDIVEAGVFNGKSLLSTALLLKELGSDKRVYGFDSFYGFPDIGTEKDNVSYFDRLADQREISPEHLEKVHRNQLFLSLKKGDTHAFSSSTSDDFSNVNMEHLKAKIKMLGLNNIVIVPGSFEETMGKNVVEPSSIMAVLIDCDLYKSYKIVLDFVWERLERGGYIYLDEYYSLKFPGARVATNEFFADKKDKPQRHIQETSDFERWYVRKIFE